MPATARVALLVTCLVDLFRPSVGFAAVKLLEEAGCTVEVPRAQTCCGQPAYNSGDRADAKAIARQVIDAFAGYDYVVAPSGSCAGMVKVHYPELFADEPDDARARRGTRRRAPMSSSRSSSMCAACDAVAARWRQRSRPITMPARACASSASRRSRASCSRSVDGLRAARIAGRGGVLRLRRHVLRQIPRDLRQDGRATRRPTSPRPAPMRCSPAISAAC